jgi:selenocysteine-specific elongation factor
LKEVSIYRRAGILSMDASYFTIGMAGHIDHGKTTLTKALTNVDTDRLKEEKERNISIELGFAPLQTEGDVHVSIVDMPGHERFIRQMIAGVAGIDLVVLVIAADEGVMPQTKEHLEIIEFLGITRCIVAVSKIDRVDRELLQIVVEDIKEGLADTVFQNSPFVYVDSISGKGIDQLKKAIFSELKWVTKRDSFGSFRLPIDHVFSVQGQGTIVRGTVNEGSVYKGSQLTILPKGHKVKARQIQVHHHDQDKALAGQRAAINLGGIDKGDIRRGDVLVASDHFLVTNTVDVTLQFVDELSSPIKQRSTVKMYIGTSEVMGKIVFFDRNEVKQKMEEVLCQIRLEEDIVIRRGDRFIIRRPSPMETLGGGWVIRPSGGKYRFGEETIEMLQKQKDGTPLDLIHDVLSKHTLLDKKQLIQLTSLDESEVENALKRGITDSTLLEVSKQYALTKDYSNLKKEMINELVEYHEKFPMKQGRSKAELVQLVGIRYPKFLIEYCVNRLIKEGNLSKSNQLLKVSSFQPHLPKKWEVKMGQVITNLEKDGVAPRKWEEYVEVIRLSKEDALQLSSYLIYTEHAYRLTEDMLIHQVAFKRALEKLKSQTGDSFKLKEAKDILDMSRKYLIPFLELLDQLKITTRQIEEREWS